MHMYYNLYGISIIFIGITDNTTLLLPIHALQLNHFTYLHVFLFMIGPISGLNYSYYIVGIRALSQLNIVELGL